VKPFTDKIESLDGHEVKREAANDIDVPRMFQKGIAGLQGLVY